MEILLPPLSHLPFQKIWILLSSFTFRPSARHRQSLNELRRTGCSYQEAPPDGDCAGASTADAALARTYFRGLRGEGRYARTSALSIAYHILFPVLPLL
jgi:hypothetical protein